MTWQRCGSTTSWLSPFWGHQIRVNWVHPSLFLVWKRRRFKTTNHSEDNILLLTRLLSEHRKPQSENWKLRRAANELPPSSFTVRTPSCHFSPVPSVPRPENYHQAAIAAIVYSKWTFTSSDMFWYFRPRNQDHQHNPNCWHPTNRRSAARRLLPWP